MPSDNTIGLNVPVEEQLGTPCVPIHHGAGGLSWLYQVVFGKERTTWSFGIVTSAIAYCCVLVRRMTGQMLGEITSLQRAHKWVCVATPHGNITMIMCPHNMLHIKSGGDTESLKRFVELVCSFKEQENITYGHVVCSRGSLHGGVVPEVFMRTDDFGKVAFDHRNRAWRVRYKLGTEQRKQLTYKDKRNSEGLEIPDYHIDFGEVFTTEQFASVIHEGLKKARTVLNRIDKSGGKRIPE